MRRFVHSLAVCLLASSALAGCGSSKGNSSPELVAHLPTSDTELEAMLSPKVPTGYSQEADSVGDTGPSDMAKAVRDAGSKKSAEALLTDGFVRGYQRLWHDSPGASLVLFVYQFKAADGALAFFRLRLIEDAVPPRGDGAFPIQGMTTETSFGLAAMHEGAWFAEVVATTGPFVIIVHHAGTDETRVKSEASTLLMDQRAKLEAVGH